MQFQFSIDRGGTFTDIYCTIYENNKYKQSIVKKVLSEDTTYGDGPKEGIRRILEENLGISIPLSTKIPSQNIKEIRMGTTVATNALLERKGARTALIVTKGFKDILKIGNQSRGNIFDLKIQKYPQIYQKAIEIDERVQLTNKNEQNAIKSKTSNDEYIKIIKQINPQEVREALEQLKNENIESISVIFVHSPAFYEHELLVEKIAKEMNCFKQISLSHKILPLIKMLPRAYTTTLDAYLNPFIFQYMNNFINAFDENIYNIPLFFMQSDGGLCSFQHFTGSKSLLSGPAGGVVGFVDTSKFILGQTNNYKGIIGFDMGGTSTDVSRFAKNNGFEHIYDSQIAGVMVQTAHLDINTVAAGGGSRLFIKNGAFVVGPESSGALPGPVCYGNGGFLSISDANVVLGRLVEEYFPKIFGKEKNKGLFIQETFQKFEELKKENQDLLKSMNIYQIAAGFVKVANETMCRPIRNLTQGKGCEPKNEILSVFGGAGGQHACQIADNLGMKQIFVHLYAGILSAYGLSKAELVEDQSESVNMEFNENILAKALDSLKEKNQNKFLMIDQNDKEEISFEHQEFLGMRYEGTDTALQIRYYREKQQKWEETKNIFEKQYKQEFGFLLQKRNIIIDTIRVRTILRKILKDQHQEDIDSDEFQQNTKPPTNIPLKDVYFFEKSSDEVQKISTPVYIMENLEPSTEIKGPALIINNTSTILIEPSWTCIITKKRNLSIKKQVNAQQQASQKEKIPTSPDPIQLSVFSNRFMCIAEQMGRVLQKTSISTNIKERLDFSCALFSSTGDLVANAPHLPVHLGSMSESVKYQIRNNPDWKKGEVIMTNHPACGGSHLPDITVISPVFHGNQISFYTASRGHHADVGGITPGSMPPFSKSLKDEGLAVKSLKIVKNDIFQEEEVRNLLKENACRVIEDNVSDLKAQISANNKGVELLEELIAEYSLEYVHQYMLFIQQHAEVSVRNMLKNLPFDEKEINEVEYMDDGTAIHLKLEIDKQTGSANMDFTGTGYEVFSNTNAPYSVTVSAIIYCLRSLVNTEIPLNQGCLKAISLKIPENSILNPSEKAACVGGNVLTSQRITDLILKAFKVQAGSYGCMNNFTFGNENMSYYETIGGGAGAGNGWNGQDAVQCHMTNTRITDVEILERRYPVLLIRFQVREGSGGKGKYKGGNGIIREFQFLQENITVSILSERRVFAPFGLQGGCDGEKGVNLYAKNDGRIIYLGGKNTVVVEEGDRIIIMTPGGGGFGKEQDSSQKDNNQENPSIGLTKEFGSLHNYQRIQESV